MDLVHKISQVLTNLCQTPRILGSGPQNPWGYDASGEIKTSLIDSQATLFIWHP